MTLIFKPEKWNEMIAKGQTIGELLFENDIEKKKSLDVNFIKKSRVTVAQFASTEAIANTPRSPQLNNSIPNYSEKVNANGQNFDFDERKSKIPEKNGVTFADLRDNKFFNEKDDSSEIIVHPLK